MAGGRIGIDFNVPISSCAFVDTCFMASSVLAALAEAPSKAQGTRQAAVLGERDSTKIPPRARVKLNTMLCKSRK